MFNNKPLVPSFLKKFDQKLLLQQPEIWSTRAHIALYYLGLLMLVVAALSYVAPNDLRDESTIGYWVTFMIIVSILAIVFWMIFLLRFNVFKRFGNTTSFNRLKVFLLYFSVMGAIVFSNYVPPIIETIKANQYYDNEELVKDINTINKNILLLEYDSLNHQWKADTFRVVASKENAESIKQSIDDYDAATKAEKEIYDHSLLDTAEFNTKLKNMDSMVRLTDSVYVFYTCPDYTFLDVYDADNYSKVKLLTSRNLFNQYLNPLVSINAASLKEELTKVLSKYNFSKPGQYYYYNSYETVDVNGKIFQSINERYHLNIAEDNFKNIIEKKYRFTPGNLEWLIRLWLYFTLGFTLLIFMFRHSTTKVFFLSLLTLILITILTGLFLAFSGGSGTAILGWFIFYVLLFGAIGLTTFSANVRRAFQGIGINLFVLGVVFLPLSFASVYYDITDYVYVKNSKGETVFSEVRNAAKTQGLLIAEIVGFVLLFILIPTLIHRLYRKWYALPED